MPSLGPLRRAGDGRLAGPDAFAIGALDEAALTVDTLGGREGEGDFVLMLFGFEELLPDARPLVLFFTLADLLERAPAQEVTGFELLDESQVRLPVLPVVAGDREVSVPR